MQLTQQETNKVKERDEQHTVELREWRGEIAKRKQVTSPTTHLHGVDHSQSCRALRKNFEPAETNKSNFILWIVPFQSSFVHPCLSLGPKARRETGQ